MNAETKSIKKVAIFGLIGIVFTITVSWLTAAFVNWEGAVACPDWDPEYGPPDSPDRYPRVVVMATNAVVRRHGIIPGDVTASYMGSFELNESDLAKSPRYWQRWGNFDSRFAELTPERRRFKAEQASGWPTLSMWCSVDWVLWTDDSGDVFRSRGGILIDEGLTHGRGWTVIPLRPIWIGFALNTVFYATAVWLLSFAFIQLRRRRRFRRGRCPNCAYDLSGNATPGCPECGSGQLV